MYPYNDPDIIIYAAMKKPTWGEAAGLKNSVTEVVKNIAKYKGMFTETSVKENYSVYEMKSLLNKNIDSVTSELSSYELNVVKIGNGNKIVSQYPSANNKLISGDKVILITNDSNYTLPNFYGWSRIEAQYVLNHFNVDYEFDGYGYVTSQSVENITIPYNEKVILNLSDKYSVE